MKNNTTLFGYESITDYITTQFGLNCIKFNLFASFTGGLTSFITNHVWNDARAVYTLFALVILDFITGIARAIKLKRFSSARLPRVLLTITTYALLLSIGWNLSKVSELYSFLPGLLYGGLVSTLIYSVFENMYDLGLIKKEFYNKVKKRL
jgi:hypothetical protein